MVVWILEKNYFIILKDFFLNIQGDTELRIYTLRVDTGHLLYRNIWEQVTCWSTNTGNIHESFLTAALAIAMLTTSFQKCVNIKYYMPGFSMMIVIDIHNTSYFKQTCRSNSIQKTKSTKESIKNHLTVA